MENEPKKNPLYFGVDLDKVVDPVSLIRGDCWVLVEVSTQD